MSDDDKLLGWLRFAIEFEDKGLRFYKECLANTRHPRAMELFDYLVKAETGHKNVLTSILDAATHGDARKVDISIAEFMKIKLPIPIFDRESLEMMKSPYAEMTKIFNKAMEFENEGLKFYLERAEDAPDPKLKKLFNRLANDEIIHKKEIKAIGDFVFGISLVDSSDV